VRLRHVCCCVNRGWKCSRVAREEYWHCHRYCTQSQQLVKTGAAAEPAWDGSRQCRCRLVLSRSGGGAGADDAVLSWSDGFMSNSTSSSLCCGGGVEPCRAGADEEAGPDFISGVGPAPSYRKETSGKRTQKASTGHRSAGELVAAAVARRRRSWKTSHLAHPISHLLD
jgi:hypothetical protein